MKIQPHESIDWMQLFKVTERTDKGEVLHTEPTEFHITRSERVPEDYVAATLSTSVTKESCIEINPFYRRSF